MRIVPAPLLQRMIDLLMRRMRHSHPSLFSNLALLDSAVICVKPSDLPHQFVLRFGQGPTSLSLAKPQNPVSDACIKGKLEALLNLLEGRIDSDMLFFSRDIEITGDTAVIVGLRNTLDREEINLLDDITAMSGPFGGPARKMVSILNNAAQRINQRLANIYEESHPPSADWQNVQHERDELRNEVQALKTRLAKFETRQKRTEAAAQ